jgi:peptidoglycan/LPS O-acetylase OafA/YrhL
MFTEPMHGPVAWSIFWIWLGFIAVGAAAYLVYRLVRPWLRARKPPPPPPMKYADQLRQRLRQKPSRPGRTPPKGAGAGPKPPSSTM